MVKVKKDLTGLVFGRWTVIEQGDDHVSPNGQRLARWVCQCSCGSAPKTIQQSCLKAGTTLSCGCLRSESSSARMSKHSLSESKEYNSWRGMVFRCTNKNDTRFEIYGGRGITVCDRWLHSFENFYEDMGDRPEGMTLDRIDPDGNYEPENCRWATKSEQCYNQRKRVDNKSGRTGVYRNNGQGKWIAYIKKENKRIYLGAFLTFEEAAAAREAAELELYGRCKS